MKKNQFAIVLLKLDYTASYLNMQTRLFIFEVENLSKYIKKFQYFQILYVTFV